MTQPVIVTTFKGSTTVNGTAHSVALPASGIIAQQALILFVASDGSPSVTTAASGWATLITSGSFNSAVARTVLRLVTDGSENGTSIQIDTSASERISWVGLQIHSWRGSFLNGTNVGVGTTATGTTANPDPPSVTTGANADDYLFLAAYGVDSNRTTSSYPASYTDYQQSQSEGSTNGCGVGVAGRFRNGTSLSEDPGTYTISGADDWMADTIWLRGGTSGIPVSANPVYVNPMPQLIAQ